MIIRPNSPILVTGATGFIGSKVVERLIDYGFRNLRCFARPSSDISKIIEIAAHQGAGVQIDVIKGNLFSQDDCSSLQQDHLVMLCLYIVSFFITFS